MAWEHRFSDSRAGTFCSVLLLGLKLSTLQPKTLATGESRGGCTQIAQYNPLSLEQKQAPLRLKPYCWWCTRSYMKFAKNKMGVREITMKFVSESENCCPPSTGPSSWSSLKLTVHQLCLLILSLTGLLLSLCLWFSRGKGTWWGHSCLGKCCGYIWLLLSRPQDPVSVSRHWFRLVPDPGVGYGEIGQVSGKREAGEGCPCLGALMSAFITHLMYR